MGVEALWLELGTVEKILKEWIHSVLVLGTQHFPPLASCLFLQEDPVMRLLSERRAAHPDTVPASFCFWTFQNCDKYLSVIYKALSVILLQKHYQTETMSSNHLNISISDET